MNRRRVREEWGTAVVVGALYVLATAAGVAAAVAGAPTEVDAMAARSGAVLVSALLVTIMGVAVAGVVLAGWSIAFGFSPATGALAVAA